MKIIDLLNKIANVEELPKKIYCFNREFYLKGNTYFGDTFTLMHYIQEEDLNNEVEILEEEKKIPEKHINNYGDLIILGQQDNWLEPTIETDQKINAQLNPYVFEAINENFKDIENKIYEIIDYLKSKGE